MNRTARRGINWRELEHGIQIFDHSGEIRPAGDIINGKVWPAHWRLVSPDDYIGLAPYSVASELYQRHPRPANPIVLNPLTAVTLFLDNGFTWNDLLSAEEDNGYIAFRIVREKLNIDVFISDGSEGPWVSRTYIVDSCSRPTPNNHSRPAQPHWLDMD